MLERYRVQFALALVTTMAVACGDGANTEGTGGKGGSGGAGGSTSSSSSSSGSGGEGGTGGAPSCMGEGTVLAATELFFGEGNSGEWKAFGFNIDGLVSTAASKDLCQPNSGAATSTP